MEHTRQLVAVFEDPRRARQAADALRHAVRNPALVRVGAEADEVRSLRGEMREETGNVVGAGPIPAFTPEMAKGIAPFAAVSAVLGALVAAPVAAIEMGGLAFAARLLIVCCVGALAGATFGFVAGGRRGARSSSGELAAEVGTVVAVPASGADADDLERVLRQHQPMRIDLLEGEQPVATLATEHAREVGGVVDDMAEKVRHPLEPEWRDNGSAPA